jgi:hypothetical protein
MNSLESFGLAFIAKYDTHGFNLRLSNINALVDALPLSVRHLEINRKAAFGRNAVEAPTQCNCGHFRRLLPQLRNLRLRLLRICGNPFKPFKAQYVASLEALQVWFCQVNGAMR